MFWVNFWTKLRSGAASEQFPLVLILVLPRQGGWGVVIAIWGEGVELTGGLSRPTHSAKGGISKVCLNDIRSWTPNGI